MAPIPAPTPVKPVIEEHKQPGILRKLAKHDKHSQSDDEDDIPEEKTKKVNLAEERDEAIAAMDDVEDR